MRGIKMESFAKFTLNEYYLFMSGFAFFQYKYNYGVFKGPNKHGFSVNDIFFNDIRLLIAKDMGLCYKNVAHFAKGFEIFIIPHSWTYFHPRHLHSPI